MNSIILYLLQKEEFSVYALIQCSNPFISFISKFSHETAHVFLFECLFLPKKRKRKDFCFHIVSLLGYILENLF